MKSPKSMVVSDDHWSSWRLWHQRIQRMTLDTKTPGIPVGFDVVDGAWSGHQSPMNSRYRWRRCIGWLLVMLTEYKGMPRLPVREVSISSRQSHLAD
jgi:hypothetical protein